MKEKELVMYEAPYVDVLEVAVEKGFASSGEQNPNDYEYGGSL